MNVAPDKLKAQLEKKGLARVYLIFGDEPLQALECSDLIRATARDVGITERVIFEVEAGFDWQQLRATANEMSLFAERRLLEIRLKGRKPDKTGGEVLAELLSRDDALDVFLVTADALDRRAQQAKWFKLLDGAGVSVQARQIPPARLESWIRRRAQAHDLELSAAAAELIAVRAEGNLLAAAQELEKLRLLLERGSIDADTVLEAMVDSARYNVFGLVDANLAGDGVRAIRMLRGLRQEGVEPVVLGWALNREVRLLARIAAALAAGKSMQSLFNEHKVWDARSGLVRRALERIRPAALTELLSDTIRLDRIVKGAAIGNPWDELELLCLKLSAPRDARASRAR